MGEAHGAPHALAGGGLEVAHLEILHRHSALDHLGLEHVHQRIHPELVVRRKTNLRLGPVEVHFTMGAFEIVALGDLLDGLIDGIVHLLEIGTGGNIERSVAGHRAKRSRSESAGNGVREE